MCAGFRDTHYSIPHSSPQEAAAVFTRTEVADFKQEEDFYTPIATIVATTAHIPLAPFDRANLNSNSNQISTVEIGGEETWPTNTNQSGSYDKYAQVKFVLPTESVTPPIDQSLIIACNL